MRQTFTLEKKDMEMLKDGGSIPLRFDGGTIELKMEARVGRKYDLAASGEDQRKIIRHMLEFKKPVRVAGMAKDLGMTTSRAHAVMQALRAKKVVVNSSNGWRVIYNTSAVMANGN